MPSRRFSTHSSGDEQVDNVAGLAHMDVSRVGTVEKRQMPILCLSLFSSVLCQDLVNHHG